MSLFRSSPAPQSGSLAAAGGAPAPPPAAAGGLFAGAGAAAGGRVEVPEVFLASAAGLEPLSAPAPAIRTPQDDGIAPADGDDTSAPNAVTAARLNRIVCVTSANVGYSKAAKDQILPSSLEYVATVEDADGRGEFGLTLRVTLEYESAFPEEGMVVWMKKHQQVICDETEAELMLVETSFEDFVQGSWQPISTDVRYAEEAEAVVQAVITTDSGQTAGRVKTEGAVEDAKLGPVGERGRIVLTYRCNKLYSYAEMSLAASDGGRRTLVPLALQLPWAALDNPANHCAVKASVQGPAGSRLLCPQQNVLAYRDLAASLRASAPQLQQVAIVPAAAASAGSWAFERPALPPRPTLVLAWLSVPDADDGWEQLGGASLPRATRATLLRPGAEDLRLLAVALPGRQDAHLIRCQVETEAPQRAPNSVRVHTDITISDASGSTGMRRGSGGETVRQGFNKYEELRLLKRLEAIPKLREAGVFLDSDVWNQIFVIFDHGVRKEFGVECTIGELDAATVASLVEALKGSAATEGTLRQAGKGALLDRWQAALAALRATAAGGATSFVEGTKRATAKYRSEVTQRHQGKACTAYVNFDTDGGNNCGPCYAAISSLVAEADVVQGHVMGVGAWVDQDCATRVAKLLKGTASLNLSFPEAVEADRQFREDLSRWIRAIRTTPISLTVSAGSLAWTARHGERHENGVDVLFAAKGDTCVKFGQPDVSETTHTKAVLTMQAGESTTLYLMSRRPLEQLAAALRLEVGGVQAQITTAAEPLQGVTLGHHWLTQLAGSPDSVCNAASLCTRLRQRLEDDLSFAWNLPTKSGSTAAVGRARTERRAPVPLDQQPAEPQVPSLQPQPAPSAVRVSSFGGGQPGRPTGPGGYGVFGGRGGGGKGPLFRCAMTLSAPSSAPTAMCGSAPPPRGAPALPKMAKSACAAAPPASLARSRKCKMPGRRQQLSDDEEEEHELAGSRAPTPGALLRASDFMRMGPSDPPPAAIVRAVRALKHVAEMAVQIPAPQMTGHLINEDPLIDSILGSAPAQAQQGGAKHTGFVCDFSNANPIMGVRYKATNSTDVDITAECRRKGQYPAGAAGFRPLAEPATALRLGLAAVLAWWQVVWRARADLFGPPLPELGRLSLEALVAAVRKLPESA